MLHLQLRYALADQSQGISEGTKGDRSAHLGDGTERGSGSFEAKAQGAGEAVLAGWDAFCA